MNIYRYDLRFFCNSRLLNRIIAKGKERGYTNRDQYSKMTRYYEELFWADMSLLNVQRPNVVLRVTEHMPEILQFIETIINSGYAYVVDDGVYFNVSKWETHADNYDCFAMRGCSQDEESPVVLNSESNVSKRSPMDFALWKVTGSKDDSSLPMWHSPWGYGRPGWYFSFS